MVPTHCSLRGKVSAASGILLSQNWPMYALYMLPHELGTNSNLVPHDPPLDSVEKFTKPKQQGMMKTVPSVVPLRIRGGSRNCPQLG